MSELNLYQRALDNIINLEYEYGVHMDYEEFEKGRLPTYYNISIDNVSDKYNGLIGIIYNFEIYEGSAQIVCTYDESKDEILTLEFNEIFKKHVEDKWKIYEYKIKDASIDVQ